MKREGIIRELVRGKDVLDIGSVGQSSDYSLWGELKEVAGSLVGIDTVECDVEGVVCGSMEAYDFGRKFDVIVAGDVIEHVNNQGRFLENVKKHLKDDGVLVITTPNAKWWTVFLKPNVTHTLWHDRHTLRQVLEKHGFKVERLEYYPGNKRGYPLYILPLIIRQGIITVCSKKERES